MNISKKKSRRQWLIWKAKGAVRLHDNPVIASAFRKNALAEFQGQRDDVKALGSLAPVRAGDLVVHVPADGSRGSGPLYVDNADEWGYGGNGRKVAVSILVYGPMAWSFGLPRDEVVIVGHFDVDRTQQLGKCFYS